MADDSSAGVASSSHVDAESSDSTVEVNVKTLDSQIYTFRVNRNMPVSLFKEKIASAINVPIVQQRLIFRGKVLKDDHTLTEYHLEDGHTLHLVARQPSQLQPQPGSVSGETGGNHDNQGSDPNPGAPRNRVGQVSHSVVLETFNIGDPGEGIVPDLSRIIGAVLNSVGVGNVATTVGASNASTTAANVGTPQIHGIETEAAQRNGGGRSQTGNHVPSGRAFFNIPLQVQSLQFPFPGAVAVPSLQMSIPDSLTTLSEFISRMELALSQNAQQSTPPSNIGDPTSSGIPSSNVRGLPAPEVLSAVMRRAQQLLSGHAGVALSNLAGRIEREGGTTDPATRGQIQAEAMQVGVAMQHLGALLLELGRTILTLRMGQSPAESVVNAGPAVYVSPSGPNPIMVQPFPLQASSLFGLSSAAPQANTGIPGPIGTGDMPRNISIHIHAGTALAPGMSSVGSRSITGEAAHIGQHPNQAQAGVNGVGSVNSGPTNVLPVRNVVAAVSGRSPSEAAGHVLSVLYPLHARLQQANINHATAVQGSNPSGSNGVQPIVGSSVLQPISQSTSPATATIEGNTPIRSADGHTQAKSSTTSTSQSTDILSIGGEPEAPAGPSELPAVENSSIRSSTGGNENQLLEEVGVEVNQPQSYGCQFNDNENIRVLSSTVQSSSTSLLKDSLVTHSTKPSSGKNNDAFASESTSSSSQSQDPPESGKTVPLGLGSGGLHPKRRSKMVKAQETDGGGGTITLEDQNQQSVGRGRQVLQTLISPGSNVSRADTNASTMPLPPVFRQIMESMPIGGQGGNEQIDIGRMMSQFLQNPAVNGLLEGISEQAGMGSPAGLRSIMEQAVQSPLVTNVLSQISQDMEGQSQDHGNMLLGSGRGRGGINFSRIMQQLVPVVSQVLGQGPTSQAHSHSVEPERHPQCNSDRQSRGDTVDDTNFQIDLRQAVEMIEGHDSPPNIFRSVVQNAGQLYGEGNFSEDLVEEICGDAALANGFMEMLQREVHRRLQSESNSSSEKS